MDIVRSATVALPAARVFALIEHAEDYPRFLPWCTEATILERREDFVRARVGFGFRGMSAHMLAEVDKDCPRAMHVRIDAWPFRAFRGHWQFDPLGAQSCRVTFSAQTGFRDAWWSNLLNLAAGLIADRLVAAFLARARTLGAHAPAHAPS
jgi:ribosome-associated toxin RatA of RatAB toxin-antitoxin module